MFRLRDISIERKLRLVSMLALGAGLLLACAAFVIYDWITFRQGMVRDISALAQMVGRSATMAVTFRNEDDVSHTLNALDVRADIATVVVCRRDGSVFARYDRPAPPAPQTPPAITREGSVFTRQHLELVHAIRGTGEEILGSVWVRSELTALHERVRRYAALVVAVMAAAMTVAFTLSARMLKTVSAPILRLAGVARRVSVEKNYALRATPGGRDELGSLVEVFNEMLGQIQQRDAALQKARDELEQRVAERTAELRQEMAERIEAEKATEQQLKRLSLLNHITRAVDERQGLQSILQEVLRQLEQHLPTDFGGAYLLDHGSGCLEAAAIRAGSLSVKAAPALPPLAASDLGQSALAPCSRGQAVYFENTLPAREPITAQLAFLDLRSAVIAPLRVEERLFGLLIAARRSAGAFTSGECEFLRMLSEQVSLAAHQARLYSDLQAAYDELRTTQQAVMQHERLRALGQMASGIAHDINNTLSPVVGFADLLLRTATGLDEVSRRYLQHIRTAGQDVAHIVARLREFYRPRDTGHDLKPVQFNRLVHQVVDLTRPRWHDISLERGLFFELRADLEANLPEVAGVESELREALTNLILNALDACPQGGVITLRTRSESWPAQTLGAPASTRVIVEVIDRGTGMDEEIRKRCLEPFFSTKGTRGTGLGLAMVYGIMERHDGQIEIDSQPGKGTTMRLILPAREAVAPAHEPRAKQEGPLPPLRILFVDDEPLLRELVKEMLRADGHLVTLADGGPSGLDAFRKAAQSQRPFDAIITDLGMPYLDGRQLARAVREESPNVPIIMLTGWGKLMRPDADLPALVDSIVSKPPKATDLQKALRAALARHGKDPSLPGPAG